jgi:hypothetical protein
MEVTNFLIEKNGCQAYFLVEWYWRPNCDGNGTSTQVISFHQLSGFNCGLTVDDAITKIQIAIWEYIKNVEDPGVGQKLFKVNMAGCINAGYRPDHGPIDVHIPIGPWVEKISNILETLKSLGVETNIDPKDNGLTVKLPPGGLSMVRCGDDSTCCAQSFYVDFNKIGYTNQGQPIFEYKSCVKEGMYGANGKPPCPKIGGNLIGGEGCIDGCSKLDIKYPGQARVSDFPASEFNVTCQITPNPNNGKFRFDVSAVESGSGDIKITNLTGDNVYSEKFEFSDGGFSKDININGLPSGIYIYSVNVNGKSFSGKLTIEK